MAHRPEPTTATARTKWNKEHAREKQKVVDAERKRFRDFDSTSALNRFVKEKNQPRKLPPPPEAGNEFAENLGVSTNDEFGSLLKNAINVLNKNPNDFNANFALKGMDYLYEWENTNTVRQETDTADTWYNFETGELDDQGKLVNTVQEDKQLKEEIPIGTTDVNNQTPEDIARDKWLTESRNTPAAKAFAQDDFRNEDWNRLRWEAQKRHKKLFDYNTKEE
tara:strand:+ start:42 stop:707 length:666 start_codon:yes stop_codon:yes gene_type:complete